MYYCALHKKKLLLPYIFLEYFCGKTTSENRTLAEPRKKNQTARLQNVFYFYFLTLIYDLYLDSTRCGMFIFVPKILSIKVLDNYPRVDVDESVSHLSKYNILNI